MEVIFVGLAQVLLIMALAPVVNGTIKKTKAFLQNRQGPAIWQGYYDLNKLFHKDRVVSEHSSWIFRITPVIVFATVVAASSLMPVVSLSTPLGYAGDLFVLVYLFGLARFFLALSGLDAGSSFGGMGSSREMTFAAMIEPALLLALFTVALSAGSTNLVEISKSMTGAFSSAHILAFLALFIVAVAETGRIPVDNPDTHLELTMDLDG